MEGTTKMRWIRPVFLILIAAFVVYYISSTRVDDKAISTEIKDTVVVDSFEMDRIQKRDRIHNLMEVDKIDYYYDSLKIRLSTDADEILNKTVLIYNTRLLDLYKDPQGYHLVISGNLNKFGDSYIDLSCSPEQALKIKQGLDIKLLTRYNLIFNINFMRRINQSIVSNTEIDGEDATSYITIDDNFDDATFRLKGNLLKIEQTQEIPKN